MTARLNPAALKLSLLLGGGLALAVLALPTAGQEKKGTEEKKEIFNTPEVKIPGELKPATPGPQPLPPTPSTQPPSNAPQTPPVTPFGPGGAFDRNITTPFLPDVEGTQINAGKKTSNIDLKQQGTIANNNLRQLFQTVPGINISEESSPLTSFGYRGLPPHRSQFTQILQDGIPIHADQFGYPEAYYVPPFQVVDRVEFFRGGASLMYGPQPGGSLNFITKMPPTDRPVSVYAENMAGTYGFFSTYESVAGTMGDLGYYVYGHHRESDGFRNANSGYNLDFGGGKFVVQLSDRSRLLVTADGYSEGHGEPGGLSVADFNAGNIYKTTRFFDHFQLRRESVTAQYQNVLDDDTFLDVKMWGIHYNRFSRRQNGGGFGTLPSGGASATSNFEDQSFNTFGIEPRFRRDWMGHTLAFGLQYYHTWSPRYDSTGANLANEGSNPTTTSFRTVDYAPFFAENLFRFGNLTVTPGIRIENIWQTVREDRNNAKTAANKALADQQVSDTVPLLGLGVAYNFDPKVQAYYNISQSYRPIIFTEAVSPAANQTVSGNLEPGDSWQTEIGFRGNPYPWLYWDTSLFYMRFENQIGVVNNNIQNVGDSRHQGWEFAGGVDFLALADTMQGIETQRAVSFGAFFNSTILDTTFVAGPNIGKRTQYAPYNLFRTGLNLIIRDTSADSSYVGSEYAGGGGYYNQNEWLRFSFTGTFVGNQFGNDNNTANNFIPAYNVWDLTAEVRLFHQSLRGFGGVYNVFDNRYFSRVRGDGIDPAAPQTVFAGLKVIF